MNTLKKRILIVEDEALIADHIEQLLLSAEYEVPGIFDEADELFAFLEHQTVDLVLLDINLNGDLDGVDIAHELNNRYNIPFIYCRYVFFFMPPTKPSKNRMIKVSGLRKRAHHFCQ